MVLVVVLATLLLCFLLIRHHVGVPFLAMIAGLAVYEHFGAGFASTINLWIPAIPSETADMRSRVDCLELCEQSNLSSSQLCSLRF